MKISQLIKQLAKAITNYGDMEVVVEDIADDEEVQYSDIEIVEAFLGDKIIIQIDSNNK